MAIVFEEGKYCAYNVPHIQMPIPLLDVDGTRSHKIPSAGHLRELEYHLQ